ncbi:nitrogen fixation protein NifZ [Agaribacterium sp. ZY112]|uniref:nitrogen fixation protein NifZ n=1 Tax=Agaribacterium sp. ZY112 TaxID=3233574 RepID=UPI00352314C0
MKPTFDFGDRVRVVRNVRNDGSYPGKRRGELLLKQGAIGSVRDIGSFLQDQIIYRVHFINEGKTIGCREQELIAASEPWLPAQFELRQKVRTRMSIDRVNSLSLARGTVGQVVKILPDYQQQRVFYHIDFSGLYLRMPEAALVELEGYADGAKEGKGKKRVKESGDGELLYA